VTAQNACRKLPGWGKFTNILSGNLLQARMTHIGVIACRRHPLFRVFLKSKQVIGSRYAGSSERKNTERSRQQKLLHELFLLTASRGAFCAISDTAPFWRLNDGKAFSIIAQHPQSLELCGAEVLPVPRRKLFLTRKRPG
jgi:hypothetical protein